MCAVIGMFSVHAYVCICVYVCSYVCIYLCKAEKLSVRPSVHILGHGIISVDLDLFDSCGL